MTASTPASSSSRPSISPAGPAPTITTCVRMAFLHSSAQHAPAPVLGGMDRGCKCLHYPNMDSVPTYALYGETHSDRQHDWLHWETIQSRSRLHGYRIDPHRHEQLFQILSLTGGSGHVTLDGARFELIPPMVVVVPAMTVHGYVFSDDVEGVVVTLMARDVAEGIESPLAGVIGTGTAPIHQALQTLLAEADSPGQQHDLAMR